MQTSDYAKQVRRLRLICIALLVSILTPHISTLIWKLNALATNPSRPFLRPPEWFTHTSTALKLLSFAALVVATILIIKAKVFRTRRQSRALVIYTLCSCTYYALLIFSGLVLSSMKRPPGATYSDPMFTPLQKFVIYSGDNWTRSFLEQAAFIALLLVALPPGLKLTAWRPTPEIPARIIVLTSLVIPWAAACNRLLLLSHQYLLNSGEFDPPDLLREISSVLRFLYPYHRYFFLAAGLILLILIYRRAHRYIFSPNHCAACAYPLDTSMTTCPECGHSRAPQHPPLPEG